VPLHLLHHIYISSDAVPAASWFESFVKCTALSEEIL
jgi:hypothetical protein